MGIHAFFRLARTAPKFFFTVNLLNRRSDLLVTRIIVLRDAIRQARIRAPFHINGWVALPNHMHRLWTPAFERVKKLAERAELSGQPVVIPGCP